MRLLFLALLPLAALAQNPTIGVLDFYGLRQVTEQQIRDALGSGVGDMLPRSRIGTEEKLQEIPGVVRARLEATCCSDDGGAILYVGIEERGAPLFEFHSPPADAIALPDEIRATYNRLLAALAQAVRDNDTGEDVTQGHSLMANQAARAEQEQFLDQAAANLDLIRNVLRNSADPQQRAIAAYVIGYAPDKSKVIDDLLYALRDSDETVRDNAMRSLTAIEVLARLQPSLGLEIPPTWMIEMLNSLVWSDRSIAAANLVNITDSRDEAMLNQLRSRALPALIDMAQWQYLPHALPPFILLGRVLGMEEQEIQDTWSSGNRDEVIARARELLRDQH